MQYTKQEKWRSDHQISSTPITAMVARTDGARERPGFAGAAHPAKRKLRGRYVALEPLSPDHAPALWPLAQHTPQSWTWLPLGPFRGKVSFSAYMRFAAASQSESIWCVRHLDSQGVEGAPSGWLGLLDIQPANAAMELGNIWFPPPLSRTRAATEAVFLLLSEGFDHLGYQRIAWKCDNRNEASKRAAGRLGFDYEGLLRAHMIVKGVRRDTAYFSMLAEEWPARREALLTWLSPKNFSVTGHQISALRRKD